MFYRLYLIITIVLLLGIILVLQVDNFNIFSSFVPNAKVVVYIVCINYNNLTFYSVYVLITNIQERCNNTTRFERNKIWKTLVPHNNIFSQYPKKGLGSESQGETGRFLFMRPGRRVKCEFYSENWGFLPHTRQKLFAVYRGFDEGCVNAVLAKPWEA